MRKVKLVSTTAFRLLALMLCMAMTVPQVQADDFYVLSSLTTWDSSNLLNDNYKMTESNGEWTWSFTPTSDGDFYFRILGRWSGGWYNDGIAPSYDGAYVTTSYQNCSWNNNNAWKLTVTAGNTYTLYKNSSSQVKYSVDVPVTVNYYVKGDNTSIFPNGWNTGSNTQMTDNGDGTYTWTSGEFHLDAGTYYSYKVWGDDNSWHPSGDNATFNGNDSGTYTVTITYDSNTGEVDFELNLIQLDPVQTYDYYAMGDNTSIFPNGWSTGSSTQLTDNGDGTYTWTSGENHLEVGANYTYKVYRSDGVYYPSGPNPTFNVNVPGTYTVTLTYDSNTGTVTATPTLISADPTYTYDIYVRYTGNESVSNVYVYAWDGTGTLSDAWNGSAGGTALSTLTSQVINGHTYYHVAYTSYSSTINVIFNENGSSSTQTANQTANPGDNYFTYNGGASVVGPTTQPDEEIIINYYVKGDNTDIFPNGWETGDNTKMSDDDEDGVYTWTTASSVHLDAGTYGYKVWGDDNTWHPSSSDNATFEITTPGTYTVTVTYDSNNEVVNAVATLVTADPQNDFIIYVRYKGSEALSNVYVHGWHSNVDFVPWPGTAFSTLETQTVNGYTYYKVTYSTYDSSIGVLFNENGSSQTEDISLTAPGTYYFTYGGTNVYSGPNAAADPAITYYAESSFAGWSTDGTLMTENGDGGYSKTFENVSLTAGTTYEYRVFGADGTAEGVWMGDGNETFTVPVSGAYNVVITLNSDGTMSHTLTLVQAESQGTFYIEGSDGLGLTWSYAPEQTLTFDSTTGLYSYTATIEETGTYSFAFANGQGNDWDDFNNNYRIGPQSGGQTIALDGNWVSTQMAGGDNGAYSVTLGAGTVTIYFDAANMRFMIDGVVPTYGYTFYVLPVNTTATPHLYLWDENNNELNGEWAGAAMTDTETLADGNAWHVWNGSLLVNMINAIVSGGSNADQTQNITNLDPNTYYIKWDGTSKTYTISTVPPTAEGDPLYLHGTYYYNQTQHTYLPDDGTPMRYDSANQLYYLNNVTLNDQNTFCFTTGNGETWELAGTRYGNGGPDYYDMGGDGTNYLAVTPGRINTQMPLGEWDEDLGEYRMATAGVFNMMVSLVEGNQYVKLIRTDSISLSPMNVYLEQTDNVEISNIQDPGTTYSNAMFSNGYWPLSAYDRVNGGSDHWSTTNQYSVTHLADTITPDGKKWWHWQVTASICELFFTRTNKAPYQSTVFDRKAGILWVTWDETVVDGETVTTMTDHSREYFESSATELPSNATVVEGHYYVYFINNVGWETVYCNAWNVNGSGQYTDGYGRNMQTWPGQACECIGVDPVTGYEVWRYDFGPIDETTPPTGLLFNDGNTYAQTQTKEQTGDFVFQNGAVYDYLGQFYGAYTLNNLIRTAVEDERYTISDDLLGVYYDRDAKTEITYTNASGTEVTEVITGALYAKDLNQYGEKSMMPDQSYTDYVYDICSSTHNVGKSQIMDKKTDYDQSNWVKLVVSPLYDGGGNLPVDKSNRPDLSQYVDRIIPGGKMVVYMDDRINPTAYVTRIEKGAAQSYEPNVYVSSHFNDSIVFAYTHNEWQPKKPDGTSYQGVYRTVPRYTYDSEGNITGITREVDKSELYKMFYVAPKPQEVAYLTWIVYDNPNTAVTTENGDIYPYGDYESGQYTPQTQTARILPNEAGAFYAPKNWHRGVVFAGDTLNYLSEEGYGVEFGPYSNGFMQYGGVKVNWSLFGDSINGEAHRVKDPSTNRSYYWWQIFQPGQAYKIKAIIRYAHDSNGKTLYVPSNGEILDENDPAYDERAHVMSAPRRLDNGQGNYANMEFTPYPGLDASKFIIFPIEAYPGESNGDSMGNVTAVEELTTSRTVVSTRYYNLMGVASDKPMEGINIVVTTYSDGSRTSKKILR